MWRLAHLTPVLAILVAALASGCGSGSGSPSETSPNESPPSPARTATGPAGAASQPCGNTTVTGTARLRVTGLGCDVGRGVVANWSNKPACSTPAGSSRFSCNVVDDYRCLGIASDDGIAVSCSRAGSSLSFVDRG